MKKKYIAPALNCMAVNTCNMLAGSFAQSTSSSIYEDDGEELGVKSNNQGFWDDNYFE